MQKDFSYPLVVADLSLSDSRYELKANQEELVILTDLLDVQAVNRLDVVFKIKLDRKRQQLKVDGELKAEVELQSVVSLNKFIKKYNEKFSLLYNTKPTSRDYSEEEELFFDEDVIEDIEDGKIDLALIATEQLALLIDDYPKMDGEEFSFEAEFEEEKKNPFAILQNLKK